MTISNVSAGLRIVSVGGGTGLSSLLLGLKAYVGPHSSWPQASLPWIESLTAVVTVTDDGGSSGRLRDEFRILPPGDIRNCMVALAEDEHLLTELFRYRFQSNGDLSGHSFGNLFLAALAGVTGDFLEAIRVSGEVLKIRGKILPSTTEDVTLVAELDDGRTVRGETNIVASRGRIASLRLSRERCRPLAETLEAIGSAHLITIGPGSLYTSIIPNLLVEGVVEALRVATAPIIYICNIMTQPGETEGFTVEDHLRVLSDHSPGLQFDYVLVNSEPVGDELRARYEADGSIQVNFDHRFKVAESRQRACQIIPRDLVQQSDVIRHDPAKLAKALLELYASAPANKVELPSSGA